MIANALGKQTLECGYPRSCAHVFTTLHHKAETQIQPFFFNVPPIKAGRQMRRENVNNMPESSREKETEERGRDREQRDQENQTSRNVVSVISQLADDNLTLVRVGGGFTLGLFGDSNREVEVTLL